MTFTQVLAAEFALSDDDMKTLNELSVNYSERKLVTRSRVTSESIDRVDDGYKLALSALNNKFPPISRPPPPPRTPWSERVLA